MVSPIMSADNVFKPVCHDNNAFVIDVPMEETKEEPLSNGLRASPDSGVSVSSDKHHKRLRHQDSQDSSYVHRGSLDSQGEKPRLQDDTMSIVCINPLTDEIIEESNDLTTKNGDVSKCCAILRQNVLLIFLLVGLALGIGFGFVLKTLHPDLTERQIMYVEFPGILLLRVLKMVVLPLISSSLIVGMASLPSKTAGRLGGLAALYYLSTTLMSVILGVILVTLLQPGQKGRPVASARHAPLVNPVDALLDLVRNAIPDNIVTATFRQSRTVIEKKEVVVPVFLPTNTTNSSLLNATDPIPTRLQEEDIPVVQDTGGLNVLGIVAFCVTFGVVIGRMGPAGKPFLDVCKSLHGAMVRLVRLVTWYSPVGICFLIMTRILRMTDPVSAFTQLGWYVLTVVVGLLLHGFIILPAIYAIFLRKNPFSHMLKASQALLTAFGTASSSATIPVTLRCMEREAKLKSVVCRFILPVGGTINMDGTALYEAVAAIFIAQVNGIALDLAQVITVSLTATAAAIGAAGLPEGGLVTMVIVLASVGLPVKDVGLIYAVDWLLDRCRTTINVWGDCVGAAVVQRLAHKHLVEDR